MKETAVEWLISEIQRHNDSGYEFHPKYNEEIIKQALEIEKQQIINAYLEGDADSYYYKDNRDRMGEDYYNETFKSE